jgi:polyphenol oxidase
VIGDKDFNQHCVHPSWQEPGLTAFTTTRDFDLSLLEDLNFELIDQVHGADVIKNSGHDSINACPADAVYSFDANHPCVIRTADCLPILIYSQSPKAVAAIHGGWRSLAAGVIENTLDAMAVANGDLKVWLGPCISKQAFEVGSDVYQAFCQFSPDLESAFAIKTAHQDPLKVKYTADLQAIAKSILTRLGVTDISCYQGCTYQQDEQFYSYRRSQDTGRMYSIIYFEVK